MGTFRLFQAGYEYLRVSRGVPLSAYRATYHGKSLEQLCGHGLIQKFRNKNAVT